MTIEETSIAKIEPPVDVDKLDTAKPLTVIFAPYQTTLEKWEAKAASLKVTSIEQKTEMQQARLARLELKAARVGVEKTRHSLVENLKARTSKIDEVARTIRRKLEGLEETLLESEQFAERHAAKVKADLKAERENMLSAYSESPVLGDLSDLSEDAFMKVLEDAKLLKQAKAEAAAKAEAERLARIEADRIERERIVSENARIKAEAAAVAAQAAEVKRLADIECKRVEAERAAERKKLQEEAAKQAEITRKEKAEAQAKAEAERKRLEAVAAEERKKAQAEAAEAAKVRAELAAKEREEAAARQRAETERRAAAKAAREAAAAPDKAKIAAYLKAIREVPVPSLKAIDIDIRMQVENFVQRIEVQAGIQTTKSQLELTP